MPIEPELTGARDRALDDVGDGVDVAAAVIEERQLVRRDKIVIWGEASALVVAAPAQPLMRPQQESVVVSASQHHERAEIIEPAGVNTDKD